MFCTIENRPQWSACTFSHFTFIFFNENKMKINWNYSPCPRNSDFLSIIFFGYFMIFIFLKEKEES